PLSDAPAHDRWGGRKTNPGRSRWPRKTITVRKVAAGPPCPRVPDGVRFPSLLIACNAGAKGRPKKGAQAMTDTQRVSRSGTCQWRLVRPSDFREGPRLVAAAAQICRSIDAAIRRTVRD